MENRHFSGAIPHYLCIFNRKFKQKLICIAIRSTVAFRGWFDLQNSSTFNTNFLVFDTKPLVFDTKFLVCYTKFIDFDKKNLSFSIHNVSFVIQNSSILLCYF